MGAHFLLCCRPLWHVPPANLQQCRIRIQPGNHQIRCFRCLFRLSECTFPHRGYAPSSLKKCIAHRRVPLDVGDKLGLPEICPASRGGRVTTAFMTMPKASMHENSSIELGEDQIGMSGNILRVETIPEAAGVQCEAQCLFRPRIFASDPSHHPGPGRLVNNICHKPFGVRFHS